MSASLSLSQRTAARMAEMDAALGTGEGGIAETVLAGVLDSLIMDHDAGLIMSGWTWDDPEACEKQLMALAARWALEDARESPAGGEDPAP